MDRRAFLKGSGAVAGAAAVLPLFDKLGGGAEATSMAKVASTAVVVNNSILVKPVAQQSGIAQYYVLDGSRDGSSLRVAMHFPVPVETNLAGILLSTCITQDSSLDKTSLVPWVATSRQTELTNGTIVEHIVSFETHKGVANMTKRNRLDDRYNDLLLKVQNAVREIYWGWGFERSGI